MSQRSVASTNIETSANKIAVTFARELVDCRQISQNPSPTQVMSASNSRIVGIRSGRSRLQDTVRRANENIRSGNGAVPHNVDAAIHSGGTVPIASVVLHS